MASILIIEGQIRKNSHILIPRWRLTGEVSAVTVGFIARKLGMPTMRPPKFSAEARAKIAAALRANPNAAAVAKEIAGVSHATVRTIAKEANIPLLVAGKRKRLTPEQRALIIRKLKANPNACVVAREVGNIVSDRTVQIIAKKAQIPLAMGGWPRVSR